jgi:methylglutaconyl-CoA hydratase
MSGELAIKSEKSSCVYLTLNRPTVHNAMNEQLIAELSEALHTIQSTTDYHVCVLQSRGETFCAGADLHWMQRSIHFSKEENKQDSALLAQVLQQLHDLPIPTVAVVQGNTFGGGLGIIAACDMVIAADHAKFCFSETKLGLIPAIISPYIISAIGERAALRLFLTAESFSPWDAKQMGLIHEIVPKEDLQISAEKMIAGLLRNGPAALRACKDLIRKQNTISNPAALQQYLINTIADLRVTPEAQEGLQAFLEKRPPKWQK